MRIRTERIDDIPLLVQMLQEMGVEEMIDAVVPRHGNRQGLSAGQVAVGWLTYMLSESDHRMSFVEAWAGRHLTILQEVLSADVRDKDFTDDRLGALLSLLGDDGRWEAIEDRMNQHHLRVFALPQEVVRLDTTTAALYHDAERSALIAYGHSKDHRPDLAQVKVMVGALDPLAFPLITQPLSGKLADDPLYIPAIERVRESAKLRGLLYVGDSKMEKLATRGHIVQGGDDYLLPLSQKHGQGALLAQFITEALQSEETLTILESKDGEWYIRGREWRRQQQVALGQERITWAERLLLVQSQSLYRKQRRGLESRLQSAITQILQLTPPPKRGRRQFRELPPLQKQVESILRRFRVSDLLHVSYHFEVSEASGRKGKARYRVEVTRNEEAIQARYATLGWRLYVTNASQERLPLANAIRLYRGAPPTIERLFSRLKGHPLGLRPVFVRRDDRIKGLIRLLSIALRTLTLLEFIVHCTLAAQKETLVGLYPGSPTMTTSRPTAERLLQAFQSIELTIITLPDQQIQHVTTLSPLQNRILQLLKFSSSIYTNLAHSEPVPI